ncbi:transcriptional regulator, LacI family [Nakamurella panacisegetis]|uniref:Transcriptional regulator, LacI family n=1 Tax=Nakamurella panacisegetis TaxID=1090615 RepID=A0A1H0QM99_9ACTN|nr:LacI family DNA-binding transcriptional regulator [Nakamurella panacisegetis]SDP17859.1 transcriptional regulator, LacI family [Nakamurella panacisegetis]
MTTMADVARRAGVSVSTVSHVVNQTRFINPDTKSRVLEAIEETGFMVNPVARALTGASTATIGLAMSAVSNFYFADMVAGIDNAVRAAGNTLLLADTHEDPKEELAIVRSLHQRRVDGILLAPVTGRDGAALKYLRDTKVPSVLVDRCAADDFDQIGVENIRSTALLTEHLIGHGHRRIGLISGVAGVQTTIERTNGYRRALRAHGIRFDKDLLAQGNSDAPQAEAAVRRLLASARPPTALVIGNNHMTIGALRGLRRAGMRVPEDMALGAFDDFDWADVFSPHLTAIAQPIAQIAERAVTMLLERINGVGGPPRTERPAGLFRVRESCGCPAVDDHEDELEQGAAR